jgi:serine/threonine-protein kinase RsbT
MPSLKKELLEVLRSYMSGIMAGSVLSLATKWSEVELEALSRREGTRLLGQLEKGIRLYVPEGERRAECMRRLEAKVSGGEERGASSVAPPATARVLRPRAAPHGGAAPGADGEGYTTDIRNEMDVLAARGASREISAGMGFSASDQVRVATVISELSRHMVRYAGEGKISINGLRRGRRGIEIVSEDTGLDAEIADRIARDEGLVDDEELVGIVGVRKLVDEFEVLASPEGGCVLRLRKFS